MEKLGMRPSSAWYIYKGSTPLINSMLSIKYLLSKEDIYNNPLYPNIDNINGINVYENPYQLPLGFVVNDDIKDWDMTPENVFLIQNDFVKRAAGIGRDVLIPLEVEDVKFENVAVNKKSDGRYGFNLPNPSVSGLAEFTVKNPEKRLVYLYIKSRQVEYIWFIKDGKSEGHNIRYYPYIIDTQYFDSSEIIDISVRFENDASGDFSIYACYFDEDAFFDVFKALSAQPLVIDTFTDTHITGKVNSGRGGVLFTSIPFDRGWSVVVDGESRPPENIADGFISVSLPPGEHDIAFSYTPVNFIAGVAISLLSIILLVAVTILGARGREKQVNC
jgi:uncharacterized membrane protein YfhO